MTAGASQAAVIYSETLATGGDNAAFSSIGWSAYVDSIHNSPATGTYNTTIDISGDIDSLAYLLSGSALIGSSSTNFFTHVALTSDAGTIDPAGYENDLTISFTENATDAGSASPAMGWRALVQVGSAIYASDFISFSSSFTNRDVAVSGSVWHLWTDETDLSNGFNIANISGAAGTLPAGTLSNIGILAIDGGDNNDRMRLTNFSISGTVVPEPGSLAMMALGAVLALPRRHRQ